MKYNIYLDAAIFGFTSLIRRRRRISRNSVWRRVHNECISHYAVHRRGGDRRRTSVGIMSVCVWLPPPTTTGRLCPWYAVISLEVNMAATKGRRHARTICGRYRADSFPRQNRKPNDRGERPVPVRATGGAAARPRARYFSFGIILLLLLPCAVIL